MKTQISLKLSTSALVEDPKIQLAGDRLTVEYRGEDHDNTVRTAQLAFQGVLSMSYCEDSSVLADDVLDGDGMHVETETAHLAEVARRWNETVGWHEHQQEKGGWRYKQYRIYFDEVGSLSVVAEAFTEEVE